jgi:hypothetical protein
MTQYPYRSVESSESLNTARWWRAEIISGNSIFGVIGQSVSRWLPTMAGLVRHQLMLCGDLWWTTYHWGGFARSTPITLPYDFALSDPYSSVNQRWHTRAISAPHTKWSQCDQSTRIQKRIGKPICC